MRRLIALFLFLAPLAWAQQYDTNGNMKTKAAQGTGTNDATLYWNARLTDGTNYFGTVGNPIFATVSDGAGALNVIVDSGSITANAGTNLNTSALLTTTAHDNAFGTAGAADTQVRTVQGIAAMTPLLVDGSAVTQPISAASLPLPTGAATAANQDGIIKDGTGDTTQANVSSGRVHVDGSGVTQPISAASLPLPTGAATSANQDGIIRDGTGDTTQANVSGGRVHVESAQATAANLNVRPDTSGATAAAPPARANYVGGLGSGATGGFLTGIPVCDSFVPVNISTATTTLIVTGVSGRHVYICGLSLVTAAANNVALISGTGATCGTSTAGMTGGTTAASGYNLAANGGIAQGSGLGAINRTETTGDSVCIVTSAGTQLSGALSYAIY